MEEIQKKFESEVGLYKATLKDMEKALSSRQQLAAQLTENNIVKQELDCLPANRSVFKSIGPTLIKTDVVEAKQNVTKRIDYISKELKRVDDMITSLEKKQDTYRKNIGKMQAQVEQNKVKMAMQS